MQECPTRGRGIGDMLRRSHRSWCWLLRIASVLAALIHAKPNVAIVPPIGMTMSRITMGPPHALFE